MELIGHENTKKQLHLAITASRSRNSSLPHMLFSGTAGCGKTSLAKYIAVHAGYPFLSVTPNDMIDRKSVIKIFNKLDHNNYDEMGNGIGTLTPTILFFDEVHNMPKKGQEIFGIAMEEYEIAASVINKKTWIPYFTLIGATTLPGKLTKPFRERFKLFITFQPYSNDELAEIVCYHAKRLKVNIMPEGVAEIVNRSRGIPRIAVGFIERLRDIMLAIKVDLATPYIVNRMFEVLKIDSEGCTETELRILKTLFENNIPVGLENLAIITEVDHETLKGYVEPFLIRKGLMLVSGKGRIITQKGIDYIEDKSLTTQRKKKDIPADYERKTMVAQT